MDAGIKSVDVNLPRLIVAASESDPDQLYATGFRAPDPFVFLRERSGHTVVLLSDLEIDRGRREATVDEVAPLSEIERRLTAKKLPRTFPDAVACFLKLRRVRSVAVPASFPLGLAEALRARGIRLKPIEGLFWREREFKTPAQLKLLSRALAVAEIGMARGFEVLRASEIAPGRRLRWAGVPLTSERLRAEIESAILHAGGSAGGSTIVAGGGQACDPHERGHGPLRANELIILDIFPRDNRSGYFGDITRTVVRGNASDAQRHLWETCLEGQCRALAAMRPGVKGGKIHDGLVDFFTASGYPTGEVGGRLQGFFHGTGHGLGLEIHEEPRFSRARFRPGQVLTVEPGIYIPGLGGVRHEDVTTITADGHRLLTRFPKPLEL